MTDGYRDTGFTDREYDEFPVPVAWHDWPREHRIDYLRLSVSRPDLLAVIRGYLGSDRTGPRVDKRELAMIALELEVVS